MSEIIIKTYKSLVSDWWDKENVKGTALYSSKVGAEKFAAYLDTFKDLTPELQVLAMLEAKKVDRECMSALIDHIGQDEASRILKPILGKFVRK